MIKIIDFQWLNEKHKLEVLKTTFELLPIKLKVSVYLSSSSLNNKFVRLYKTRNLFIL